MKIYKINTIKIAGIMALIFLLLGDSAGAATLKVDKSGGSNYTKIQDAINNASNWDTILVNSGTYYENVNVTKRLILRGVDTGEGKPIVDASGNGSAITLSAGWSTLEGFTAINSGSSPNAIQAYAGIYVNSDGNIIRNNNVSNSSYGIFLISSNNNTLSSNIASSNYYVLTDKKGFKTFGGDGIILIMSNYNTLRGNTANSNHIRGIGLESSSNNMLTGNNASNNYYGISLKYSGNNTLDGDIVLNNSIGIYLTYSGNNTLRSNTANSNKGYGIGLSDSDNNMLNGNTANSNIYTGISLVFWLWMKFSIPLAFIVVMLIYILMLAARYVDARVLESKNIYRLLHENIHSARDKPTYAGKVT